ncbi:MAG: GTP-binding protein [Planctomycetota bacterium]
MDLAHLRNVGIFAHIDAGKTTLTERILLATGRERRAGRVDDGTTVMDWMPEERERGITITAAATRVPWGGCELNLIDTPGHVDFSFEVDRALRALDGAVLVLDAVAGVQAQTETVWRQLARAAVPAIVFVNKCDRPGSDALVAAATLATRLGVVPVPIAYPWHDADGALVGVFDLVARRGYTFAPDGAATEHAVPADASDEVDVLRAELIDALASRDEALLNIVGAGREPAPRELLDALRRGTLAREFVPVLVGAAQRGVGVQQVLDAVVSCLPSPLDVPLLRAHVENEMERPDGLHLANRGSLVLGDDGCVSVPPPRMDAPFVAAAFKVQSSRHGDLVFVRVLSGRVTPGMELYNPRVARREHVSEVLRLHADATVALESAAAGDIVALAGLAETGTGDTLVTLAEGALGFAGVLEPLRALEPVVSLFMEPADDAERARLGPALARLMREDPSFAAREDPGSGQWTAHGMGELHLEVTLERLTREFGVTPRVGRPHVALREVLVGAAEGSGVVERAFGGQGGHAEVTVHVRPQAGVPGAVSVAFGAAARVPEAHRSAVAAALAAEAASGPRFGLPFGGVHIEVVAGAGRADAQVEGAWVQAALAALRMALRAAAGPAAPLVEVHEPFADVIVETPEAFSSGVIGDLQARRAVLGEVESALGIRRIRARAPLVELFGYTTALRSLSQGRAVSTVVPIGYGPVPEGGLEARGLFGA